MLLSDIRPQVRQERSAERLYHRDVGFPDNVNLPRGFTPVIRLNYGGHAREEAMADRYGQIDLPHTIDIRKGDIFEIGVTGNTVTKIAVRMPYNDKLDITLVINTKDGFVRTVWANDKNDQHKTLNRAKYADPKRH